MENINEFLADEYKQEELREKGIKPLSESNKEQSKIYVRPDYFLVQSNGIPKDYNERAARTDEIKELNKMVSQ